MLSPALTIALTAAAEVAAAAAVVIGWRVRSARRIERATAARLPLGPDGVVRGAEPIALDGPEPARAVLLLHGFGDTPQTLRYLAEDLHAHGYTVRAPLLPGHGRTLRDFRASGAAAWIGAARDELRALRARHGRVAVVGLSMGGAIASVLAAEISDEGGDLPALVLISPYLDASQVVRRVARWHRTLGLGTTYLVARGGERSVHDEVERAKTLSYRVTTPRLLHELVTLADRARAALGRITAPTLIIQSREDNRIAPEVAERAHDALGARERRLVWVERCGHVITVDFGRERVFALVREWLGAHHAPARAERQVQAR